MLTSARPDTPMPTSDPVYANHLALAEFARGLAARLLAETSGDGRGSDDEYLRGYARAMADVSEALVSGDCCPGGPYSSSPACC